MISTLFPTVHLRSDEWCQNIAAACEGMGTSSTWHSLCVDYPQFEECREAFFWILERFLTEGRVRLSKNDIFLEGTPQELVQKFRDVFPKSDIPDPAFPDLDASYWFYKPECPGDIRWLIKYEENGEKKEFWS